MQRKCQPLNAAKLKNYERRNSKISPRVDTTMIVDTKYLMKIETYAKKEKITRQGVWYRIQSGLLKEDKNYTRIDGDIYILSNSRVVAPRFEKEFKKELDDSDEDFIDTFN